MPRLNKHEDNAVDEGAKLDALKVPGRAAVHVRLADGTEEVFGTRWDKGEGLSIRYLYTVWVTGHLSIRRQYMGPNATEWHEVVAAVYAPGGWLRVTSSRNLRPELFEKCEHRLPT